MASSADHPAVTGNSFFDTLPDATRTKLLPSIRPEIMKKGRVLAEPGETLQEIFFPVRSVISTVTITEEGAAVEVGLAGHEGLSPLHAAFGSITSRHSTVVQIPDSAFSLTAKLFLSEFVNDAELRKRCLQYAEYSFVAATQFAACNGVHPIDERYARWILMAHDRVGSIDFSLTQEYSAQMLGVRRATVTEIALGLAERGLISYRRGRIAVIDRAGLEDATCECFAAVNDDLFRLMGYGARQTDVLEETK